jgi:hypothetical protein
LAGYITLHSEHMGMAWHQHLMWDSNWQHSTNLCFLSHIRLKTCCLAVQLSRSLGKIS